MSSQVKNIVLVGDRSIGKTSFLHAFSNKPFVGTNSQDSCDKLELELTLDDVTHSIIIHNTAGQEEFEILRRIIYQQAHCFLLCYSVDNRASFDSILTKWIPELQDREQYVPIVLVATKYDLSVDKNDQYVTIEEGEEMARTINANAFMKCSSKDNFMVQEIVYGALRAALDGVPEIYKKERCYGCNPCKWCLPKKYSAVYEI